MLNGVIIIEGHVQGLSNARSAAEMGYPVWVLNSGDCITMHSKSCSKFYQCSPYHTKEFINELLDIGKENSLKNWLIIPSNDYAVINLSKNKKQLSPYYNTFSSEPSILEKIVNKRWLLTNASAEGISIPNTYYDLSVNKIETSKISFPLITKGIVGQDFYKKLGKKAFVSHSKGELIQNIVNISSKIKLNETFTQELIFNEFKRHTISVCCFCVNGKVLNLWMGEKLNQHPVTLGTATLTKSIFCEELVDPSKKLISALNYTGICEIEWLFNPKKERYNLIEINPRSWLWIELAKASGINFIKDMIDYLNQEKIIEDRKYETNIYWYNPVTYYTFKVIALFRGVRTFSPRNKVINCLFQNGDNKPGWIYIWSIINIFRSR